MKMNANWSKQRIIIVYLAIYIIIMSLIFIPAQISKAQSAGGPYSKLVYPGKDGRLVYVSDDRGNVVPDFSYAGYMGGGVKLPEVPVKVTVNPIEGDDSMRIQSAIDRVSMMPLDKNGFRGAVLLKKGTYELYSPISIHASGVVLRGVGQGEDGTVLKGWGRHDSKAEQDIGLLSRYSNMIIIKGSGGLEEIPGTTRKIVDDYVPVGTRTFHVESVDSLQVGDTVIVRRYGNLEWIRETGMYTSKTDWNKVKQLRSDSDRVITVIDGNRVTVDAPIVNPIETRWGGGELIISHDPGRINNVGIENLRGISLFDESVLWARIPIPFSTACLSRTIG